MTNDVFEPLAVALKDYFSKPFRELPKDLRGRVEREFFGLAWGNLTEKRRQAVAAQWDALHDPAGTACVRRGEELGSARDAAKFDVHEWETAPIEHVGHKVQKDAGLRAAKNRLETLDAQHKHERGDYVVGSESGPLAKKKERTRIDALSEAIEEAIRLAGRGDVDACTPGQVMNLLKSFVGGPESCIKRVVGDGVKWQDQRGLEHGLDIDALRHRLHRRSVRLGRRSPTSR